SERIKPGDAMTAHSDLPATGLAAAPVGPAKFATTGVPGDSGGGGLPPPAGDVTAAPLNLEVAITAPTLGPPAPPAQPAAAARKRAEGPTRATCTTRASPPAPSPKPP